MYPKVVEKAVGENQTLYTDHEDPAYFVFVVRTDKDEIPFWAKEKLAVLKVVR